jgi:hypothetical protein
VISATDEAAAEPLPWLLFRLAGRVSDEDLAFMRLCVADAETDEAVDVLAAALGTGRLPLTAEEADVAGAVLRGQGADAGLVDLAPTLDRLPEPPYSFLAPPADEPAAELVDVAVAAADLVGGLRGLWWVRRSSDLAMVGLWLAEAEALADTVELTAELQDGLAGAGDMPPRVEVFAEGADLTPYHDAALAEAKLVWTATDAPEPLVARVFDGADPRTGPFFAPERPRLEGGEREQLLAYLGAADTLLTGFGYLDDIVEPGNVGVVPVDFRSDGRWIWTDAVTYYLERYGIAPDPGLAAHVLSAGSPPPRLSRLALHRALEALTGSDPDEEEATWHPG